MSRTTVINIRSKLPYDIYIGRYNSPWKLQGSIWGNPFKVGRDGDIAQVLERYRQHVLGNPKLMAELPTLKGKVLSCWCKNRGDEPCHGDVLIALLSDLYPDSE